MEDWVLALVVIVTSLVAAYMSDDNLSKNKGAAINGMWAVLLAIDLFCASCGMILLWRALT